MHRVQRSETIGIEFSIKPASNLSSDEVSQFFGVSYQATKSWQRYQSAYFTEKYIEFRNETQFVFKGNELIGILPISFYKMNSRAILSNFAFPLGEVFTVNPIYSYETKLFKSVLSSIMNLKKHHNVGEVLFATNIKYPSDFYYFPKERVHQKRITLVNELSISESEIFQSLRSRYRTYIRKYQKEIVCEFSTSATAERSVDLLKRLHYEAANRVTRSNRTWEIQAESVADNEAFVVLGKIEGEYVGGCLVNNSRVDAFYSVGAYSRKLQEKKVPIGHLVMWAAIKYAGLELGLQRFILADYLEDNLTEKEERILRFKEGFSSERKVSDVFKL
jgi:hypothetical protein